MISSFFPPLLVPIIGLFFPIIVMGFSFLIIEKEKVE